MLICIYPYKGKNLYVKNIVDAIAESGYDTISMREIIKNPFLFFSCKVFLFNWMENIESKNRMNQLIEFIIKNILIYSIKCCKKKLLFVMHNRQAHNSESRYSFYLMKKLLQKADNVIIMCMYSVNVIQDEYSIKNIENKIQYIPHPNYSRNYQFPINQSSKFNFHKKDELIFLFFGAISPYKNIEIMIDVFMQACKKYAKAKLIIAGNPSSLEYEKILLEKIHSKNIITLFKYIPDNDIPLLYKYADIVILPYEKTKSLNSGAAFLSFTFKKTIICPRIGTILDLEPLNCIYSYDYVSEEQHYKSLKEQIEKVIADFTKESTILVQKGEKLYNHIMTHNSFEEVQSKYKQLLEHLIKN